MTITKIEYLIRTNQKRFLNELFSNVNYSNKGMSNYYNHIKNNAYHLKLEPSVILGKEILDVNIFLRSSVSHNTLNYIEKVTIQKRCEDLIDLLYNCKIMSNSEFLLEKI